MASKASATAIIRAARGICSPLGTRRRRGLPRLPSYQAAMFSTMPRISVEVQLRRRISRLMARARAMMAASSLSSRVGFEQHVIGRADDADIVQHGDDFQLLALALVEIQPRGPGRTGQRHADRMAGRGRVLALQGGKQAAGDAQPPFGQLVVGRFLGRQPAAIARRERPSRVP